MRALWQRHALMVVMFFVGLFYCVLCALSSDALAVPGFDIMKMSDMSDFDPTHPIIPTGDTIKIGVMSIFSGAGAVNGEGVWIVTNWVAHDINKRGGIFVDGKWKKIQLIRGDTQGKPAIAKEVAERLCLEEKVHVLWGTNGSHIALPIQQVAGKYKVIFLNCLAPSDDLMNGKNFNRYSFRTCWTTTTCGYAFAYFLSQRQERRFYILCQDYLFGHDMAEGFKQGLKKYKPNAEIVGEDYHPLFTKDFAPYLTKIKGSRAEAVFTSDWMPDSGNLLKQARDLAMKLPFVECVMNDPGPLQAVGPSGAVGQLHVQGMLMEADTSEHRAWLSRWNQEWKKWKKPYNSLQYKWPLDLTGGLLIGTYWLVDILQRAASTDPEKIIQTWEGDEWNTPSGLWKMRACDHQAITDLYGSEYVYPNKWFEECAYYGKIVRIPAKYVTPPVPADLERCRK